MPAVPANALLLGTAGGMRTFVPPAALALDGRIGGRARIALLALAVGELLCDKHPKMKSRLDPGGLGARLVSSGLSGRALAGDAGAAAGPVAVLSAFACATTRAACGARIGGDRPWAVAEDLLAAGLALTALRMTRA